MGLFWLILLGLIVWLVIRLLPGSNGGTTRDTGRSALEILDRRLASGEIDLITCKPNEPHFWAPCRQEVTTVRVHPSPNRAPSPPTAHPRPRLANQPCSKEPIR